MSEYPKWVELFGQRSELDHAGHSWHRADSAEEEQSIRARHEVLVVETQANLLKLYEMARR